MFVLCLAGKGALILRGCGEHDARLVLLGVPSGSTASLCFQLSSESPILLGIFKVAPRAVVRGLIAR
jgi:hypothetical protein